NDVQDIGAEDADWEEVGGVFFVADADGVAGVGAAAVADDDIGLLGQKIDDFALAFIAPLKAEDAGISLKNGDHARSLSGVGSSQSKTLRTVRGGHGGVKVNGGSD